MAIHPPTDIKTKAKRSVAVYLSLSIGVILAAILAVVYIFSGK